MMPEGITLSICVPAYNEEKSLRASVEEILATLSNRVRGLQVIIVDDGSTDGTSGIADELSRSNPAVVQVVHHSRNLGIGACYRDALAAARGDYFTWFPGDNENSAEQFVAGLAYLRQDTIVVFHHLGFDRRSFLRRRLSRTYTHLVNACFGMHLSYYNDLTMFPTPVLRSFALVSAGSALFAESIIKAVRQGCRVVELAVPLKQRAAGPSKVLSFPSLVRLAGDFARFYGMRDAVAVALAAGKKTALAAFGILIAIVIAEAGLRLAGGYYYASHARNSVPDRKEKGVVRILCLGDSNTFGMGAAPGLSYPDQLQRLLDAPSQKDRKFVVYNAGVPGNTSSKLLAHLEDDVERFYPDIVIILVGANDPSDFTELNYSFLRRHGKTGIGARLDYAVSTLRVYKLLKRAKDTLEAGLWQRRLAAKRAMLVRERDALWLTQPAVSAEERKAYLLQLKKGERYFGAHVREASLAAEEFKRAIAMQPQNPGGYFMLAGVYEGMGDLAGATGMLEKAVELDPCFAEAYSRLWYTYYGSGKKAQAREALEKCLSLKPRGIPVYLPFLKNGFPDPGDTDAFIQLLHLNVREAVRYLQARRIKVILQNYPGGNWVGMLREDARELGVPFVDNTLAFLRIRMQSGYDQAEYFAEDTHCTAKGYSVIAENVLAAVQQIVQ